jgi:hypothetical protein
MVPRGILRYLPFPSNVRPRQRQMGWRRYFLGHVSLHCRIVCQRFNRRPGAKTSPRKLLRNRYINLGAAVHFVVTGLTGSSLLVNSQMAPPTITAPPAPTAMGEFRIPPEAPGEVPAAGFLRFFLELV